MPFAKNWTEQRDDTSRLERKRAEAEREAKDKSDDVAAEKLFRNSPDYWPTQGNAHVYAPPLDDIGWMLIRKRWDRASTKNLGAKEDVATVRAAVIRHMKHPKAKVNEIRWISSGLVMVMSNWDSGPEAAAGYTYALRKNETGWIVLAYYQNWIA